MEISSIGFIPLPPLLRRPKAVNSLLKCSISRSYSSSAGNFPGVWNLIILVFCTFGGTAMTFCRLSNPSRSPVTIDWAKFKSVPPGENSPAVDLTGPSVGRSPTPSFTKPARNSAKSRARPGVRADSLCSCIPVGLDLLDLVPSLEGSANMLAPPGVLVLRRCSPLPDLPLEGAPFSSLEGRTPLLKESLSC